MKYSSYVGRIGALAVALGIGSAIAAPAGIAWADSETASDSPDNSTPASSNGTPDTTGPSGVETSPNPTNNPPATSPPVSPSGPTTPSGSGTGTSNTVDVA